MCARAGRERWLPSFIKVAAIGTLADVVPLVGENRVIARLGLGAAVSLFMFPILVLVVYFQLRFVRKE